VSSIIVLDASYPKDRSLWLDLWAAWPEREVAAHPNYLALFASPGDRMVCAVLESVDCSVIFPLILRPIAREAWAAGFQDYWDATSPYGYGGPFCWGCSSKDISEFWLGFKNWAVSKKLVSLFVRLSLFPEQLAEFDGEVVYNAPNVVRFLDKPLEAIWMDYSHKVRKNVKRAQREGVRVEIDLIGSRLDDFLSIYYDTMDRRSANSSFYFSANFFKRLIAGLSGQFAFFHSLHGETVVSTELVLISTCHIYSFLGGTRAEVFKLRPNDLLKHEIILWGHRVGKKAFVLGGGYGGIDGIYRYKLSFAPRGAVPFNIGQIVFDQRVYDRMIATRHSWEVAKGREWQPPPRFFPAYRAKSVETRKI